MIKTGAAPRGFFAHANFSNVSADAESSGGRRGLGAAVGFKNKLTLTKTSSDGALNDPGVRRVLALRCHHLGVISPGNKHALNRSITLFCCLYPSTLADLQAVRCIEQGS